MISRVGIIDSHNLAELNVQRSIAPPVNFGVCHNATALYKIAYVHKVKEEQKYWLGKSGLRILEEPFHTAEMLSQYL